MKIEPIKVIFLDIDGVLNSMRSFSAFKPLSSEASLDLETSETCDPVSVKLINMVVEKFNAKIVVSSSHRIYFMSRYSKDKSIPGLNTLRLQRYIHDLGVFGSVIDGTPEAGSRGGDIHSWIEDVFPSKFPTFALESWCAIDDSDDFLPEQRRNLVQTTWNDGYSYENYLRTISILSGEGE